MRPFLVLAVVVALGGCSKEEAPSAEEMRAYRLSVLSDTDLIDLQTRARDLAAQRRSKQEDANVRAQKQALDDWARCDNDLVYKVRNENACRTAGARITQSIANPEKGPSDERVFEELILGQCAFVRTKGEAKKLGCLPARKS